MAKYLRPWVITRDVTLIPNTLLRSPEISSEAKICWAVMSRFSGGKTFTFASRERIAEEMAVSTRSVDRYFDELRIAGYIETARRRAKTAVHHFLEAPFSSLTTDTPDDPDAIENVYKDLDSTKMANQENQDSPEMASSDSTYTSSLVGPHPYMPLSVEL